MSGSSSSAWIGYDGLAAVLAVGVVVVGVGTHRAGPIERTDGGDVREAGGLHEPEQGAHPAALELEDAERLAATEQLVGLGVRVEVEVLEDDGLAAVGLDVREAVVEHREVAQAEEVHLEQAQGLAGTHVELGDDRAVLLATLDRDDVEQRLGAEDDAGGVHAPLALEPLDASRGVDDPLDVTVGLIERAELGGLGPALVALVEDPGQRDVLAHDRRRHRLGDPLAHHERIAEHPAGVLDRRLGLDGAVGDDLADPLLAVGLGGVADHVAASALVEVEVDVRHGDALWVEESLEQQAVLDRVELGDAQRPGDRRAGGAAAAGTDADAVLLGVPHQVGDDEEVAGEAHLGDDADLVRRLRAVRVRDMLSVTAEPAYQAQLDLLDQPRLLGLPGRAPGTGA